MKQSPKISPFNFLLNVLKPYKKEIINIYIISSLHGLLSLSLPLGIQYIVNFIMSGMISTSWVILVSLILLGLLATALLQIFQSYLVEIVRQKVYLNLTLELAYAIPRWSIESLKKFYNPELTNRYFDIILLQKNISKFLIDFSLAVFKILFSLMLLSFYHNLFIALSFLIIIAIIILLTLTHKNALRSSIYESKYKYATLYWLQEMARSIETFKLTCQKLFGLSKTDQTTINYIKYRKKHFNILMTQYFWLSIFNVFTLGFLLILGSILVMKQQMNIGQFIAAELLIIMLINSIQDLIKYFEYFYDTLTSAVKLEEIQKLPIEGEKNKKEKIIYIPKHKQGIKIELNNLSYQFEDKTEPTLKNVNLTINPGERILIYGTQGTGKTLLAYLLCGFYENYRGNILYDDLSLSHIDKISLRQNFVETISKSEVIYETLYENISFGRNISTEEVLTICQKLNIINEINNLADGIFTQLQTEDKRLSKSMRYKIKLARALVGQPRLILFNEILPNIHTEDKLGIIKLFLNNPNNATIVSFSDSLNYRKMYDRAFEIRNKTIFEI